MVGKSIGMINVAISFAELWTSSDHVIGHNHHRSSRLPAQILEPFKQVTSMNTECTFNDASKPQRSYCYLQPP